jgi:hypothetical protein
MPANKAKNKSVKKAEWKGYLRVNLTKEQEQDFDVWRVSQNVRLEDLGILCNNGFKFSLNWDVFHNGVSASLFAADSKLAWAGYVLTAWAGDTDEAVLLLLYKHYIICEEDWEHFYDVVERSSKTRG